MLDTRPVPNLYDAEAIPEDARAEIEALLLSGDLFRYTAPEDAPVARLERGFAAMMGARYALAVSSCSAALFLSLKALGLPRGTRVLIPGFTFAAVPSAVVHAECEPVLVEVNDTLRIDLLDFERKLTDDIGAVLISHMRGHTSDMDAIMALAEAHGVPVVEDAAHSLGTRWHGQLIGTLGRVGCFSFQSYKLLNAGEGGMLITDDAEIFARAVIMSGAYEHNWRKHDGAAAPDFARWQNKLPLYNTRMGNLSAAILLPQLAEMPRRARDGRRNHDHLAARLNSVPSLAVPPALGPEERAPDSMQFQLCGMTENEIGAFRDGCAARGVPVQIFGRSEDNARAFWNWEFLGKTPELPKTRAMLMRTCDLRLPARLTLDEVDVVGDLVLEAARAAAG
ncbi:MAG: aminotransferase class I/II-fold pyridoxal phosphate-dependent enzyme [Pseudomonadota bacterium]